MTIETSGKHPIPPGFGDALVQPGDYARMYAESISDPDGFWGREGRRLDWIHPYSRVKNTDFAMGQVSVKWCNATETWG